MNPFPLDPATLRVLLASMRSVDICDETGTVVGYFVPKINPADYEAVGPEISHEEIQRRLESKGRRYSTAEVIEHLKQL